MSPTRETWAQALASALEANAVAVVQMAPGHWAFAPAGAPGLRATTRLANEWLLFDAPLPEPAAAVCAWDVFAANTLLPGGLKGCTGAPDGMLHVRAELPLLEELPIARAVQEVCTGLALAPALLRPAACGPRPAPSEASPSAAATSVDLQQLCAETAWPFTARTSDMVMVELDVPGAFQQAAVALQPHRGVVVSVSVLSELPAAPVCESAVGAFLLRVTGAVRMVRAAAGTSRVPVCFEVVRAAIPEPVELAHVFAALSLAWRYAGRETAVLAGDERAAQLYLDRAPPRIADVHVEAVSTNNQQATT